MHAPQLQPQSLLLLLCSLLLLSTTATVSAAALRRADNGLHIAAHTHDAQNTLQLQILDHNHNHDHNNDHDRLFPPTTDRPRLATIDNNIIINNDVHVHDPDEEEEELLRQAWEGHSATDGTSLQDLVEHVLVSSLQAATTTTTTTTTTGTDTDTDTDTYSDSAEGGTEVDESAEIEIEEKLVEMLLELLPRMGFERDGGVRTGECALLLFWGEVGRGAWWLGLVTPTMAW